jgi:5-formyltetrahydrofolate cyclo-ligase
MDKQDLRIKYIKVRKAIKNRASLSDIISENVLKSDIYAGAKNIGIYVSFGDEVSTTKLISQSLLDKKNVFVPAVEKREINFYTINNLEDLCSTGAFGIPEPVISKEKLVNPENIDLLIVPGICFDLAGNRLGYGKGFYDKFMTGLNAIKIGVCFEEQLLKNKKIPAEATDVSLDFIVTEKGVYGVQPKL